MCDEIITRKKKEKQGRNSNNNTGPQKSTLC